MRISFVLGLLVFFSCPAAPALTLSDARAQALAASPQLRALKEEAQEKQAVRSQLRANYFPRLGVAGGAERDQGQSVALGYLYADWNLFRGYEDAYRAEMASLDLQISELRLERAKFRLALQVEALFHRYLLKDVAIRLREEALRLNAGHRKMAAVRAGAGMSTKSDVMEFDLRETLLHSDLAALAAEREEARVGLSRLLASEDGKVIPEGTLDRYKVTASWAQLAERARREAEPVAIARLELGKGGIEAKLGNARFWPSVNLEAQYGYLNLDSRPAGGGMAARGMILARLNLFDGMRVFAERSEGEAKRLKSEARLEEATRAVLSESEVAFRKLTTTQARIEIEANNEDTAQKYYRAVVSEYRRGVKNSGDVRMAAEMLYEAQLRKRNFLYDFIEQRLELERLTGSRVEIERVATGS